MSEELAPDTSRTLSKLYMDLKDKQATMETKVDVLITRVEGWEDKFGQRLDHIIEQTTKTNGSVKELKVWKEDVCYPLNEMITERKDNRSRIKDVVWSFTRQTITAVFTALATGALIIFGFNNLIK